MKMKKLSILLAFLLLLFSLLSCTKTGEKSSSTENKGLKEESIQKSEKAEEEINKETNKEVSILPHLLIESYGEAEFDEAYNYLYRIGGSNFLLKEEDAEFEALRKGLEAYNKRQEALYDEKLKELKEKAAIKKGEANTEYRYGEDTTEFDINSRIIRADKSIVSIFHEKSENIEGEHTDYYRDAVNFDTVSGKELRFSDVVKDEERFFALADEKAKAFGETADDMPSELLKKSKAEGKEPAWTVHAEGVSVYFDVLENGVYQKLPKEFTVRFDEAKDLFETKYTVTEEDYVIFLTPDVFQDFDIEGDGKKERVCAKYVEAEGDAAFDGQYEGMKIIVGDKESETLEGFYGEPFLLKKAGKYYIYLFMGGLDDSTVLFRIDLTSLKMNDQEFWQVRIADREYSWDNKDGEEIYRSVRESFTDARGFYGESRNDVLSTNNAIIEWTIGNDAYPKPNGDRYKIIGNHVLHTLKDFSAKEVDGEGKIGKDTVIPADSYLAFIYTDNENWVDMRMMEEKNVKTESYDNGNIKYFYLKDESLLDYHGPCYRLEIDRNEDPWVMSVNGIDVNEILEGMAYAG